MVIAQLDTPDGLLGVVVQRVAFVEAVTATPDAFPIVQLVSGPGLQGLVVNGELYATSRSKQEGLPLAVGGRFHRPLDLLDARNVAGRTGTAMQAGQQIRRRLPALNVQRQVDGTLVALDVHQDVGGVVVEALLQTLRAQNVDGMGRHLDLEVRADHVRLGVEVLDQKDEAQIDMLELVLVARILADTPGMPALPGEIDNGAGILEQLHDFGPDQSPIELANRIHPTPQQADMAQVDKPDLGRVDKHPTLFVFGSRFDIDPVEVSGLHVLFSE